jgi:hypothetical protein
MALATFPRPFLRPAVARLAPSAPASRLYRHAEPCFPVWLWPRSRRPAQLRQVVAAHFERDREHAVPHLQSSRSRRHANRHHHSMSPDTSAANAPTSSAALS